MACTKAVTARSSTSATGTVFEVGFGRARFSIHQRQRCLHASQVDDGNDVHGHSEGIIERLQRVTLLRMSMQWSRLLSLCLVRQRGLHQRDAAMAASRGTKVHIPALLLSHSDAMRMLNGAHVLWPTRF